VESGGGAGAIGVKVAIERVYSSFENQAAVRAGLEVAPYFNLYGRRQLTFQVPAD
jgi:hypothetical protein